MCYDVSAASTIWQPCQVQVQKQTTSWDYGYTILIELCFERPKWEGDDSDVATGIYYGVASSSNRPKSVCNFGINFTRIRGTSKYIAFAQRWVDTKCTHSCTGECGWDKSNHQAMQSFRTFSKTCILKLCCRVWTFAGECCGIADAQHIEFSKKLLLPAVSFYHFQTYSPRGYCLIMLQTPGMVLNL